MIVCNNCGASYEDDEPRCPYCGGDNFGRSVQMHEDAVNELKREKRQWEEKPQRMAKTGMSLTAKILIVVIVAGLLLSAAAFIGIRIHAAASGSREQAMQEKLEKMYQQQDYSGIWKSIMNYMIRLFANTGWWRSSKTIPRITS